MNGDVKTYNLKEPMRWSDFQGMPEDLRRDYLGYLQSEYKANDRMMSQMFGVTDSAVNLTRNKLGVPRLGKSSAARASKETRQKWQAFVEPLLAERRDLFFAHQISRRDNSSPVSKAPEEKPVVNTNKQVVAAAQRTLQITWDNVHSWEELYALVNRFPFPEKPAHVQLEVN